MDSLSVGPGPLSPVTPVGPVTPVSHHVGHVGSGSVGSPVPGPPGILTPESNVQTWMDIRVGTYPNVSSKS